MREEEQRREEQRGEGNPRWAPSGPALMPFSPWKSLDKPDCVTLRHGQLAEWLIPQQKKAKKVASLLHICCSLPWVEGAVKPPGGRGVDSERPSGTEDKLVRRERSRLPSKGVYKQSHVQPDVVQDASSKREAINPLHLGTTADDDELATGNWSRSEFPWVQGGFGPLGGGGGG